MKKILNILFFCLVATIYSNAQETKNVVYDADAEVRTVGDFTGVDVSSAIALYLSQGKENAVAISVDGGDKSKVKTEVKNGVLKISVESSFWGNWNWHDHKIKAYVTVKDINRLSASGASKITITNKLTVSNLKITNSGASSIKGEVHVGNLQIDINGASSANLSGTADQLGIQASGASNIKAYDLIASTCNASASGASSIKVNVAKEFQKIHASGASSIRYKGNATVKNIESSGASSLKKEDN